MAIVFYPNSRFDFVEVSVANKLTPAQFARKISRLPGTARLEKALSPYLPRMSFLGIRGTSDKSRLEFNCFLISARPINRVLTPEEAALPRFFHKLYGTIAAVSDSGLNNLKKTAWSEKMVLSFYRLSEMLKLRLATEVSYPYSPSGGIRHRQCIPGYAFSGGGLAGVHASGEETAFPMTSLNHNLDVLVGEIRYRIQSVSKLLLHDTSIDMTVVKMLKKNAVIYRDTLKLLLKLAQTDNPHESILIK